MSQDVPTGCRIIPPGCYGYKVEDCSVDGCNHWGQFIKSGIRICYHHTLEIDITIRYEAKKPDPAALIGAAPELLAACKLALAAFEHGWCIDWHEIEKAINKAEGR